MKTAKRKIKIILTILCLVMVYALATKEQPDTPPVYNINVIKDVASHNAYTAQIPQSIDSFEVAEDIKDEETLHALAQKEAQKMVKTGDVSEYQDELKKHGLLMSVLGY